MPSTSTVSRKVDEGAGKVDEGAGKVDEGAGKVDEGAGKVDEGAGKVDEGAGKVDEGVAGVLLTEDTPVKPQAAVMVLEGLAFLRCCQGQMDCPNLTLMFLQVKGSPAAGTLLADHHTSSNAPDASNDDHHNIRTV